MSEKKEFGYWDLWWHVIVESFNKVILIYSREHNLNGSEPHIFYVCLLYMSAFLWMILSRNSSLHRFALAHKNCTILEAAGYRNARQGCHRQNLAINFVQPQVFSLETNKQLLDNLKNVCQPCIIGALLYEQILRIPCLHIRILH